MDIQYNVPYPFVTRQINLPAVVLNLGERRVIQTTISLEMLKVLVKHDSAASTTATELANHINRPLDVARVKELKVYFANNPDLFVLPPIILVDHQSANRLILMNHHSEVDPFGTATLLLPGGTRFSIVDGQHRVAALVGHDQLPRTFVPLVNDPQHMGTWAGRMMPVMIYEEDDLGQVHQDFADLSKSKGINVKITDEYDRRSEAIIVKNKVTEGLPWLRNLIQQGKLEEKNVTDWVKAYLVGNRSATAAMFRSKVGNLQTAAERCIAVLDSLYGAVNLHWGDWSATYYSCNNSGFIFTGLVCHLAEKGGKVSALDVVELTDWRRLVAGRVNPLLEDLLASDGAVAASAQSGMKKAADRILTEIA